jgi:homoaconitase/3-isopropylmalate dehydratase large subunit
MGMTMTEKILARASGRESVRPGDLILAKIDFAMGHDLTIPPAGKIMREQMGAEKIWDPDRVAVTQDHFQPAKDAASAALGRLTREFSHQMGIKWYFEVGQGGICHTVFHRSRLRDGARGAVVPGAGNVEVRLSQPTSGMGRGEGPDPLCHRQDRRRRCEVEGDGACG